MTISLRVRAAFQKTGTRCLLCLLQILTWTSILFGTLKGGSLLINSLQ